MPTRDAVIVTAVRTPGGRAGRGAYRTMRPEDLAAAAIRGALERTPGVDEGDVDGVRASGTRQLRPSRASIWGGRWCSAPASPRRYRG